MSLTVRQLSRRDEDKERRIAALEAEVREFRRLIPDYLKIHQSTCTKGEAQL